MLEIGNSTSTERPPDKAGIANANPHTVEFPVLRTRQLAEAEPYNTSPCIVLPQTIALSSCLYLSFCFAFFCDQAEFIVFLRHS